MGCFAPSALAYQLQTYTVPTLDRLVIAHPINYDFKREIIWVNNLFQFSSQEPVVLPKSLIAQQRFTLTCEMWVGTDITALEQFMDAHQGKAFPFLFNAPDDSIDYYVRFDGPLQWTLTANDLHTAQLILTEAGDVANNIDNDTVYPSYVQSLSTALGANVAGSGSPQTVPVTDSSRFQVGIPAMINRDGLNGETVTIVAVPDSTHLTVIMLQNHLSGEMIEQ